MKTIYEDNSLRRYLLGSLPEAETEQFDELSFTDDEFVTRLQAVEDDLIDAYWQGELSPSEAEQFQAYYLASPRRREKVQFAHALHVFADRQIVAQATQAVVPAITSPEQEESPPVRQAKSASWWRNLFTIPNLTLQWGMAAAAVLLLLASGWFFRETLRLRGQMEAAQTARVTLEQRARTLQTQIEQQQTANTQNLAQLQEELQRTQQQLAQLQQQQELAQQQANARPPVGTTEPNLLHLELTPQTRTGSAAAPLRIPAGTGYVVLQLATEEDDFQAYQVEVRTQREDRLVWKSGKLTARPRGAAKVIDVSLRSRLLRAGSYAVRLQGIGADGQVADIRKYSFSVGTP
jgi:hypothetical protein